MLKKIITFTFILLFIFGCNYKPLYQNNTENTFNIELTDLEGDNQVNSIIQLNLNIFNNKKSSKHFGISINSSYDKIVIAKNTAGNNTNYQIVITSNFYIKSETIEKTITITEKFNFTEGENTFENNDYERAIKNNMISSITNKLIIELTKIK